MRRAAALLRASHPEPVAAVTLVVGGLAYTAGRGPVMTAVCMAAVLAGQLFVGWSNDVIDAGLDRSQERRDKPIATGELPSRAAVVAAAVALAACVPLSLAAGLGSAAAHFAGIATATLYNGGLKRAPWSVLAYGFAFAMLPAFVTGGPPVTHVPAWWATAAAGLAGTAGHFTQALPDVARDRESGVRGLPQILGEAPSAVIAAILFTAAALLAGFGAPSAPVRGALVLTAVLMAGVLLAVATRRLRAAFRLTLVAAAVVVVALVAGGARF